MKRFGFVVIVTLAAALFLPATANAATTTSYQFHLEHPNISADSHGDHVAVTGAGHFTENPNSVTGSGAFTHMFSGGGSVTGTWVANELLEFQSYGCGVVLGNPIAPNACGGALKIRVTLTATVGGSTLTREGILTVFCIIGPNPPNSHDDPTGEGIHLLVPGITNFNDIVSGMNVFVKE